MRPFDIISGQISDSKFIINESDYFSVNRWIFFLLDRLLIERKPFVNFALTILNFYHYYIQSFFKYAKHCEYISLIAHRQTYQI